MLRGKGFLRNIFANGVQNSDETSPAVAPSQANESLDALKSDYGIEITQADMTREDLMKNGYRKMAANEVAKASMVLQYIPQLAASAASNSAFRQAVAGTFRVKLDAGMHLAKSQVTQGAYRGIGLSNATNQVAGSAELIPNGATVANAPQIALGVFSVLSMATGQYFMTQINSKLESITSGIDRIEQFLDDSRRSELISACQELNEQKARVKYISSENDASDIITHLNDIRMSARKHIPHYKMQIHVLIEGMNESDKESDVDKKIKTLTMYLQEYRYATQIAAMTKLVELSIKNVTDPEQMSLYRNEIAECIEQYKADYIAGEQACKEYLDKNDSLNGKTMVQTLAQNVASSLGAAVDFAMSMFGNKAEIQKTVNSSFDSDREKRKVQSIEAVNSLFESVGSIPELTAPINAIDDFIAALNKPIDVICINDEYYTNLPGGEAC